MNAVHHSVALSEIPDSPATLEFRSLALDRNSLVYRSGVGLLLVDSRKELVCAVGAIDCDDVVQLCRSSDLACELLGDESARDALRGVVSFEPARIFVLDTTWRIGSFTRADLAIRPLGSADSLAHLPEELREEIETERPRVPVFATFIDGAPVSFAYSSSMTQTLADISIDTLEAYRNRGIGAATAASLIDWVVQNGKSPVWGSLESNGPSLRLAEKLGFHRPAGRLFVAGSPQF